MIIGKQITVYDWFDIKNELCKIMDIPENAFRDYHKIVGGDYKDFWHVCLHSIVPESMGNGTIVTMFRADEDWYAMDDSAWKNKVLQAWNVLYDSLDLDKKDSGIFVSFDW